MKNETDRRKAISKAVPARRNKCFFTAFLLMLMAACVGRAYAQDDMDLESLLDDLGMEEDVAATTMDDDMAYQDDDDLSMLLEDEVALPESDELMEEDDFAAMEDEPGADELMEIDDFAAMEDEPGADELMEEDDFAAMDDEPEADILMEDDDFAAMEDEPEADILMEEESLAEELLAEEDDLFAEEDEELGDSVELMTDEDLGFSSSDQALLEEIESDSISIMQAEAELPEMAVAVDSADEPVLYDVTAIEDDVILQEEPPVKRTAAVKAAPVMERAVAVTMDPEALAVYQKEEVRRQAMEVDGLKWLDEGFNALDHGNYAKALEWFEGALEKIPDRPATSTDRQRAQWGHADADYKLARQYYREKNPDLNKAEKHIASSLKFAPDNRAAQSLSRKIDRAQARRKELQSRPTPARKNPQVVALKKTVDELISEGRDYYSVGDLNGAKALFEKALMVDEYNTTAMRYLRRIALKKEQIGSLSYKATKAEAMAKVRETWSPPIMEEVKLPEKMDKPGTVEKQTEAEKLRERMSSIIIPKIEFRDANIQDVVDFLAEASQASDPQQVGVNFVLNLQGMGGAGAQAVEEVERVDSFGDMGDFGDVFDDDIMADEMTMEPTNNNGLSLTLNLHRISLLDAIKTITQITGLRYRIEGNIVIISPQGVVSSQIVTRMYPVQPTIIDVVIERDDSNIDKGGDFVEMGAKTSMSRADVKKFFQNAGVPFPQGTSITYNQGISQLIVANTPENLEMFERILAQLNVIPNQVEIEARFIEIAENDLRELGLEWILNDNWEIANKKGSGPIGSQERVQVNENAYGFTQGLRFFSQSAQSGSITPNSTITQGADAMLGGILSISSILTNPELSVVLHALDQTGGTDLLSAPRVTTRSGFNATIEVVEEIIYPTEFDAQAENVSIAGGDNQQQTVVVVTPGGFETREVGVILNVTPTVGPDGYTIDLAMVPEVSELVRWMDYGSSTASMVQPIFSSRNVTTSIVIWDGQTVVMGGLIKEEMTTVNDKVPLLGDIPLLGRLFRNEGEWSQKKNLLIFVTARLVDPAGKPIHKQEEMGVMPGAEAMTTLDQS